MEIRKVHVVFKTHLDIGFTDFSANVIDHYLNRYIPAAIAAGERENRPGAPKRFVWTVGSYLIDHALQTLTGEPLRRLDEAVSRGDITYHGLPFTLHSELCSPLLFRAGLDITRRLDRRYGRRTVAAKMSDVPGHTVGIIAPLAEQGIEFLHIGINGVACMPKVPPLFMWENANGQRIMVNYTRSYGGLTCLEGHGEALYFLHSNDNMGPPSEAFLSEAYRKIQERFPGAEIAASTLDAFAQSLLPMRDRLPVLRGEIGDTWIHGIGSDPKKTAMLRAMDRLCTAWDAKGAWDAFARQDAGERTPRDAFLETLLLVCEHTWGLDMKKYLTDFANWSREDFVRARQADILKDAYGLDTPYEKAFLFAKREFIHLKPENLDWSQRSYSLFEKSHQEQRAYVATAISALPEPLRAEAEATLARMEAGAPAAIDGAGDGTGSARVNGYAIGLAGDHITLTGPEGTTFEIGLPLYQEVGLDAYTRLMGHYLDNMEENLEWAVPDNGKPGAENSDAPKQDVPHTPRIGKTQWHGGAWRLEGCFDAAPHSLAGCPQGFRLELAPAKDGLLVTLLLRDKPANRKPEALYLPISMEGATGLRVRKIGDWVDPSRTLEMGNQRVHGIQAVRFLGEDTAVEVTPLDTPLMSIGAPALLDFMGVERYDHVYMNLYNNLWGTNFKMWYEEDILCRFLIEEKKLEATT